MKTARYALLLMSLVLVAACGTKGPLVLPDKAGPAGSNEDTSEPSSEPMDEVEPQTPPEPATAP